MIILDYPQGSPEWLQSRAGKVTASMIPAVMAKIDSATYKDYLSQLVAEQLTGKPQGSNFVNDAMQFGIDNEKFARASYETLKEVLVDEVGFVLHPTIGHCGASPDGLINDDGLIEIKCPQQNTHGNTLKDQKIPTKYQHQMNWQMACTGAKWNDFVSYNPSFPEHLTLCVIRLHRDEAIIKNLEDAVKVFLDEVEAEVKTFNKLKGN